MSTFSLVVLISLSFFSSAQLTTAEQVQQMYLKYKKKFSDVPEMQITHYKKLKKTSQPYVFIDVREPKEILTSKIKGTITKKQFEASQQNFKKHKIIVYCTIGYRSGKYARELKSKGFDAYNLEGSLLGWVHSGNPVVGPDGKATKTVHVYGKTWNLLPAGYHGIW